MADDMRGTQKAVCTELDRLREKVAGGYYGRGDDFDEEVFVADLEAVPRQVGMIDDTW